MILTIISLAISFTAVACLWYNESLWKERLGKDHDPNTGLNLTITLFCFIPFINIIYLLYIGGSTIDLINKMNKEK